MTTISTTYTLVWQLKFATNYQWTKDGKCINILRNKVLKKYYNSGCVGYNIKGRFYSLSYLRTKLEKILKNICPF